MDLYRADTRSWATMQSKFPNGFEGWQPLSIAQARKLCKLFLGEADREGLPELILKNWEKVAKPKLTDLSTLIKYTKDQSTFWVSTAINQDCGGQSGGAPIYRIRVDLKEYDVSGTRFAPLPTGRSSNLKPSLMMDSDDIDQATLIALNHGPRDDAELSFLTSIPLSVISPVESSRPTPATVVRTPADPAASPPQTPPTNEPNTAPPPRFMEVQKSPSPPPRSELKLRPEIARPDAEVWTCPTCHGTFDTPLKVTRHKFESCKPA